MGEIVNLRRAKKQRARQDAEDAAAENRVRFGRTKAERLAQAAQRSLMEKTHEGHALTERDGK